MGEMFNLPHRNCESIALSVLDHLGGYDALHQCLRHLLPVDVPRWSHADLYLRGLIGPGTHNGRPTLAQELGQPEGPDV